MQRNKIETAIRCLEVALHPNTSDEEILAAVAGFRRTAAGTPLSELCLDLQQGNGGARDLDAARLEAKCERLNQENFDLRLKVKFEEDSRALATRRLRRAERQIDELNDRLAVSHDRTGALEHQLEELRTAYCDLNGRTVRPRIEPEQPARRKIGAFRDVLGAAKMRDGFADNVVSFRPAAPDRREAGAPRVVSASRAPWTA
ncbi:MAG TPA: hypothetical protein VID77_01360 [Stellaceae bacterium]|jgi:hypothetical protein